MGSFRFDLRHLRSLWKLQRRSIIDLSPWKSSHTPPEALRPLHKMHVLYYITFKGCLAYDGPPRTTDHGGETERACSAQTYYGEVQESEGGDRKAALRLEHHMSWGAM